MLNVQMDYELIESTSARLDRGQAEILPILESLRTDVDGLLDNGLVLEQSSKAMREAYAEFHKGITQATEGIKGFAKMFRELKKAVEEMDRQQAAQLASSKGG